MPTITVTSADMALIKCTEAAAIHLLIVAHGRPTNRAFTVPQGKTVRQYANAQAPRQNALGPVGQIMRGKLPPSAMGPAGHRLPDYTLIPVRGYAGRPGTADRLYAALLRYVEPAGRNPGWQTPPNGVLLAPACRVIFCACGPVASPAGSRAATRACRNSRPRGLRPGTRTCTVSCSRLYGRPRHAKNKNVASRNRLMSIIFSLTLYTNRHRLRYRELKFDCCDLMGIGDGNGESSYSGLQMNR